MAIFCMFLDILISLDQKILGNHFSLLLSTRGFSNLLRSNLTNTKKLEKIYNWNTLCHTICNISTPATLLQSLIDLGDILNILTKVKAAFFWILSNRKKRDRLVYWETNLTVLGCRCQAAWISTVQQPSRLLNHSYRAYHSWIRTCHWNTFMQPSGSLNWFSLSCFWGQGITLPFSYVWMDFCRYILITWNLF